MAIRTVKLVGCGRYGYKGQLYERGKLYDVNDDALSTYLLQQVDDFGVRYFREVSAEDKKAAQDRAKKIIEAKKAAEAAAALELIERDTDSGEPISV